MVQNYGLPRTMIWSKMPMIFNSHFFTLLMLLLKEFRLNLGMEIVYTGIVQLQNLTVGSGDSRSDREV